MFCRKEILILEKVTSTLLSNEIRKRPNQVEQEGSGLMAMRMNGKERKVGAHRKRVTFVTRKVIRNNCKHQQEWLKKKGQAVETDINERCIRH